MVGIKAYLQLYRLRGLLRNPIHSSCSVAVLDACTIGILHGRSWDVLGECCMLLVLLAPSHVCICCPGKAWGHPLGPVPGSRRLLGNKWCIAC